jgi:glycosyltransferase involved in cell wall biosynthesis
MRRHALIVVNRVADTFRSRLPLVDLLKGRGYSVTVAGAATAEGQAVTSACDLDLVDLGYDPFEHGLGLADLAAGWRLNRLARSLRPALTFVFNSRPILLLSGWMPRRSLQQTVMVVTGRGRILDGGWARLTLARLLWSLSAKKAHHIVFQNQADLSLFVSRGFCEASRATIVPSSGVSSETFLSFASARRESEDRLPVLGYAGRYLVSKGVRSFFHVARELRTGGFAGRIIMAGSRQPEDPDSISEDELQAALTESDIEDLGYVADMRAFYPQVDVFLYPSSYGEGVARVLIEAALSGCACLAWDSGSSQAVLRGAYDDGLVSAGNHTLLTARTQELLKDPALRLSAGRALSETAAQRFDVRIITGLYEAIVQDLEQSVPPARS